MTQVITDMDIFVREWGLRVRSTLKKLGVKNSELLNDLEQEVYLRMIEKRTLETYDSAKGGFSTHVFQVIRTIAFNHYRAKKRNPIDVSESIIMVGEGGEEFLHPEVARSIQEEDKAPLEEFLELLYLELDKFKSWRSRSSNGTTIKSLTVVCRLLETGYKPKEIAQIFKVGNSSVSVWVKKIRAVAIEVRRKIYEDI